MFLARANTKPCLRNPQTNQVLEISWRLLIPSTNTGAGMFLFSVPTSNSRQDYNSPLAFLDTGNIVIFTNKPAMQPRAMTVVGSWARFANRYMTNRAHPRLPGAKALVLSERAAIGESTPGLLLHQRPAEVLLLMRPSGIPAALATNSSWMTWRLVNLTEGWIETMRPDCRHQHPESEPAMEQRDLHGTALPKTTCCVQRVGQGQFERLDPSRRTTHLSGACRWTQVSTPSRRMHRTPAGTAP